MENKIEVLRDAYSKNKLFIIADFNRTLTLPGHSTSFSSVRKGDYLDEDYNRRRDEDFKKYFPYESGENGAEDSERKKMIEFWFRKHLNLFVEKELPFEVLEDIVKETNNLNEVRDNFGEFFDEVLKAKIPLFIVSGGLGDMIDLTLQKYGVLNPHIKVISNYFKWVNGIAKGIKNDYTITPISKDKKYVEIEEDEDNCFLVLGDNPDDLDVLSKLKYKESLSVGFEVSKKGKISDKEFDILLEKDDSLEKVIEIIKKITC